MINEYLIAILFAVTDLKKCMCLFVLSNSWNPIFMIAYHVAI